MAWQRTALGVGGVSALLLRHAGGNLYGTTIAVLGLVLAVVLLVVVEGRYVRTWHGSAPEDSSMGAGVARLLTWGTVALAVGSLAVTTGLARD